MSVFMSLLFVCDRVGSRGPAKAVVDLMPVWAMDKLRKAGATGFRLESQFFGGEGGQGKGPDDGLQEVDLNPPVHIAAAPLGTSAG